ncbi:unnamed protein product [Brachionus calyciflorus]|uniref:E2F-associated phosphoprotein n=1 Tax=Brachionus calyciflorus TaxID=104777 RepID=A0A813MJF2_9BILA|nr:unnamed protein product [Brachionus calyciflorus]
MSFKLGYYTGYEQDDETSSEEEIQNDSKSEDEFENEFSKYLRKVKTTTEKTKPKNVIKAFEDEMNNDLDNFINLQEKKYAEALNRLDQPGKSNKKEVSEESDTDSEAELATGVRTTKKREHFTNDELFYDPEADDVDEEWMNKQRKTCKLIPSPSKKPLKSILKPTVNDLDAKTSEKTSQPEKYTNANSDAVLNCPCCMSLLCTDCQRHEKYKTQFRSMFVFNCNIKQDEQLKYPKQQNKKQKKKKNETNDVEMKEEEFDIYKPVECNVCKTEVGVYDPVDEMYHFFNVLSSHA